MRERERESGCIRTMTNGSYSIVLVVLASQ